jgi:hypothetical protein
LYSGALIGDTFKHSVVFLNEGIAGISEDKDQAFDFTIFPNPSQDLIHISGILDNDLIEIHDLSGRNLYNQKGSGDISILNLSQGTYFVKVTRDGITEVRQFVKT